MKRTNYHRQSKCSGMTMIEVIVAVTIFSTVAVMTSLLSISVARSFNEKMLTAGLQMNGEKALKNMEDNIGEANSLGVWDYQDDVTGLQTYSSYIQFQVPTTYTSVPQTLENINGIQTLVNGVGSVNGSGQTTQNQVTDISTNPGGMSVWCQKTNPTPVFKNDFTLVLKWGWRFDKILVTNKDVSQICSIQGPGLNSDYYPAGTLDATTNKTTNGFMVYQFIQDPNAVLGVASPPGFFDESKEDVDIDGDGLKNSVYAVGYVEAAIWCGPAGSEKKVPDLEVALTPSYVLQPVTVYNVTYNPKPVQGAKIDLSTVYNSNSPVTVNLDSSTQNVTMATAQSASAMKTNRIFYQLNSQLQVNLYLFGLTEKGKIPHVVHCSTSIFLRNNADGFSLNNNTFGN